MGAEIDRLDVQVEAQATRANSALDKLAGKLDTIAKSLSNVNGSGLANFANGVQNLGTAMQAMGNVKTADITRIANGLKKFAEIDSEKLFATSNAINNLSRSISSIGNVTFNAEGLSSLANAVSRFGTKMSTQATANLPQIQRDLTAFVQGMNSIGSVSFDMTGLANLISSINKLGGKSATQATANLPNISRDLRQFISGLNGLRSISFDISGLANLVSSISKLGGKSVTNAINNIPQLATALRNLMITLSTAPTVSQNIIQMTNALANLARQGNRVGTASNSLIGRLSGVGTAMGSTRKQALSLAAAFGKFYANYFLVIRGIKKLWSSITKSMDYVETLNYFNAAFGQVADSAVSSWEKAGYDSAEAYYNSFTQRAEQLTQKMTGFTVTSSGMLEATGMKNLGIDPSKLMNYQSVFAQMSSSMGVTSENALLLSNVLTEIGADLASVKNMDFDKVWTDMASGLAGMSRTLDKYGVNIRNVNLQQKLNELGIKANITALNQNDKALLRTIILLDSTKYAWGDMADTINQPANQLRLMKSNLSNLARTIGNIFLPVVAKALPYINGFIIAIQRLAESVVKLLGFEDFDWGGLGGIGSSDVDLSGLYDDADNLTDGLDNASKAAKKLKGNLQGFDELNNITTNDSDSDSGSSSAGLGAAGGLLDEAFRKAVSEYQEAWNKAFDGMEQKAQSVADNIIKAFKSGDYKGIGTYISTGLTNALNSIPWSTIYAGAKSFGTGLAQFLNGLITPDLFGAVGKTLASTLNTAIYTALSFGKTFDFSNFGKSIATGISEFFREFDFKALARTLNVWVDGIKKAIAKALTSISWDQVYGGLMDFFGNLEIDTVTVILGSLFWMLGGKELTKKLVQDLLLNVIGLDNLITVGAKIAVVVTVAKVGFDIGKEIGKLIFPDDEEYYVEFSWKDLFSSFTDGSWKDALGLWATDWLAQVGAIFKSTQKLALVHLGAAFGSVKKVAEDWFNKYIAPWFTKAKWEKLADGMENGLQAKWNEFSDWWESTGFKKWMDSRVMPKFTSDYWNKKVDGMKAGISAKWNEFSTWWNSTGFVNWMNNKVAPKFTSEYWQSKTTGMKAGIATKWNEFSDWWNNTGFKSWWDNYVTPKFTTSYWKDGTDGMKAGISAKWNEFTSWWNNTGIVDFFNNKVAPKFSKDYWKTKTDGMKTGIADKWNEFVSWWNSTGFKNWWDNNVVPKFSKENWTWSGIKDGLSAAWENAIASVKAIWNKFAEWFNQKMSFKVPEVEVWGQKFGGNTISLGSLPKFATGGFPEDGLFMANSDELVGKFSNGKTAVANNAQITAGIREAAYLGMKQAISEVGGNSGNVTFQVEGDPNGIFKVVRKEADIYRKATGRPAF